MSPGAVSFVDRGGPCARWEVRGPGMSDPHARATPITVAEPPPNSSVNPRIDPGDDPVEPTRVHRSREDVDDEVRAAQALVFPVRTSAASALPGSTDDRSCYP